MHVILVKLYSLCDNSSDMQEYINLFTILVCLYVYNKFIYNIIGHLLLCTSMIEDASS